MEPLKKAQVEGFLMFAEPELLFGNLDELCSVSVTSLVHMYIVCTTNFVHTILDVLCRQQIKLFQVVSTSEFHEY